MAVLARTQREIMRAIDGGLLLLAESNGECWLFDVSHEPGSTYEDRYRPVRRVSDRMAERLVLDGLVRGSGELSPKGRTMLGRGAVGRSEV